MVAVSADLRKASVHRIETNGVRLLHHRLSLFSAPNQKRPFPFCFGCFWFFIECRKPAIYPADSEKNDGLRSRHQITQKPKR